MTGLRHAAAAAAPLAVLLILSGCSSSRPAAADPELLSPEVLIPRLQAGAERLRSLSGDGTVAFEGPELSGSATFTVALRKPDSLLVRFEGPFGLDAGFLFLARDTFIVYSSFENRLYKGKPSADHLRTLLPLDISPDQVVQAFAGTFLPENTAQVAGPVTVEEDLLVFHADCGSSRCTYWVDPVSMLVTRFLRRTNGGAVIIDATSDAIMEQDESHMPRRISIRFPAARSALSVHYRSITMNDPSPSFAFSVPGSARPAGAGERQ
jgi:hypothetical protein